MTCNFDQVKTGEHVCCWHETGMVYCSYPLPGLSRRIKGGEEWVILKSAYAAGMQKEVSE